MIFKRENELEKAAIPFLKQNQFHFTWQVPLHNRNIDLAALDQNGNVIGIEFKLRNWKRALKQAVTNSNAFDYIYICVPGGRYLAKLEEHAIDLGVGVLIYDSDNNTIKIRVPAQKIERQWKPNVEFIRKYIEERVGN